MSGEKENLFPTLGEVADRTDAQEDGETLGAGEERQFQEIESLCMRCHENVSQLCSRVSTSSSRNDQSTGHDTVALDEHSLLQRGRCVFIPMRFLRPQRYRDSECRRDPT